MSICPVCKSAAEAGRQSSGDFKQFACPRCGNYQISGSALAMLHSRLQNSGPTTMARLSHAIHLMADSAPANEWPMVTSVNLDELLKKPLPSIDRQMVNLVKWAAKTLGDDQLGAVELPDGNHLAGIVGTIDQARADDLISLAHKDGIVQLVPDDSISITQKGWALVAEPDAPQEVKVTLPFEPANRTEPKIIKAHCNRCAGEKKAFVRATYSISSRDEEVSWNDTYDILECCGCETMAVRHQLWFSEWDTIEQDSRGNPYMSPGIKTTYWPPPIKRQKPEWSSEITDEVLRTLFDELYVALSSDLLVLATIGARTLFDRASFLQVGDPKGGFAGKMEAMVKAGHISSTEKDILEAMTDAGNASAHRGYAPTFKQLTAIVDILENYIERAFILGEAATKLRTTTPPRQPNKKP